MSIRTTNLFRRRARQLLLDAEVELVDPRLLRVVAQGDLATVLGQVGIAVDQVLERRDLIGRGARLVSHDRIVFLRDVSQVDVGGDRVAVDVTAEDPAVRQAVATVVVHGHRGPVVAEEGVFPAQRGLDRERTLKRDGSSTISFGLKRGTAL